MSFIKTENLERSCFDEYYDYVVPPLQEEWMQKKKPRFNDVKIWETVYNEAGNVAIYAAWSPKVEIYICVFCLLYNTPCAVKEFFGTNKILDILDYASNYGISLPLHNLYIDPSTPGYEPN